MPTYYISVLDRKFAALEAIDVKKYGPVVSPLTTGCLGCSVFECSHGGCTVMCGVLKQCNQLGAPENPDLKI